MASSPKLSAVYTIVGESLPVEFSYSSSCNRNGVCEPEQGEYEANCSDCYEEPVICGPEGSACTGDFLITCGTDGSVYRMDECLYGCSDGECLSSSGFPATGLFLGTEPMFLAVVVALFVVVAYLAFNAGRIRREIGRLDDRRNFHEDVKSIVKGRKDY
jgi:hypothetical protein